jgi:hypothetical protein
VDDCHVRYGNDPPDQARYLTSFVWQPVTSTRHGRWSAAKFRSRRAGSSRPTTSRTANLTLIRTLPAPSDATSTRANVGKFGLLGKQTERTFPGLVVEDAPSGLKAGHAAGAKTLAVCTSHSRQEIVESGTNPDYIVKDLSRLVFCCARRRDVITCRALTEFLHDGKAGSCTSSWTSRSDGPATLAVMSHRAITNLNTQCRYVCGSSLHTWFIIDRP